MAAKTALTIITFAALILVPQVAPMLENYKSLEPRNILAVLDFPMHRQAAEETNPIAMEELRARRLQAMAPKSLIDPAHTLDEAFRRHRLQPPGAEKPHRPGAHARSFLRIAARRRSH